MIEQIKKEIKLLKILIIFIWLIMFIFWGLAFFFNQYINNIYNQRIKLEKKEWTKLQRQINSKVNDISGLLKWKDLEKIKSMQSLYNIYFNNRYKVLPKDLVLELLEEILPPSAKIWNSLKIWNNDSINLILYTSNEKWLDILYNKFKYYSNVLKLLEMKWFDTITLNKNNSRIRSMIRSNSKYVYKTTIQLQLNYGNLIKYYSLLYHPTKNYDILKKLYGPDLIEPLKIPNNVTISDTIRLHNAYEKKYDIKDNKTGLK